MMNNKCPCGQMYSHNVANTRQNQKNEFFKTVYDSMKEFAAVAVTFWSGAQMSNAKLGMADAATLK